MSKNPRFLVLGATAKTGRRVADKLNSLGHDVRAVSRSRARLTAVTPVMHSRARLTAVNTAMLSRARLTAVTPVMQSNSP